MTTTPRLIKDSLLPEGKGDEEVLNIVKTNGFKDYTITMSSGSAKGDNFTGSLVSIEIKGHIENGDAKQLHLITKCSPRIGDFRNLMPIVNFYRVETYMYLEYLPTLFNILKENIGANDLETKLFSIPKMYSYSTELMDEFIIMGDKKTENYKLANRFLPLNQPHCELVLKQLGYWHGLGYALKHLHPEKYAKTKEILDDHNNIQINEIGLKYYKMHVNTLIKNALDSLNPETDQSAIDKMKEFSIVAFDKYLMGLIMDTSVFDSRYSLVIHGDAWTNNFLFKYDESDDLTDEMCFIDFQMSRVVSPVIDLLYFMAVSVSTEMRKSQLKQLLEIYYKSLSEILIKCNLKPEEVLPWSVIDSEIVKYGPYMIVVGAQALALHTSKKEDIPDFQTMTLDDAEEMFSQGQKLGNNESCQERIRGIILYAAENGFI